MPVRVATVSDTVNQLRSIRGEVTKLGGTISVHRPWNPRAILCELPRRREASRREPWRSSTTKLVSPYSLAFWHYILLVSTFNAVE